MKTNQKYDGMIYIDEAVNPSKVELKKIESQKEYEEFISLIPEHEISKRKNKQKNSDALLQYPNIDFEKNMMIVLIRNYMWFPPEIKKIEKDNNSLILYYNLPEPKYHEHAGGVGSYSSIIIKKSDLKIVIKELPCNTL